MRDDTPMDLDTMMIQRAFLVPLSLVPLALLGCHDGGSGGGSVVPPGSSLASDEPPTVALCWMETLYRLVKQSGTPPPVAARIYGYGGVALYESVVEGTPGRRPLRGQLNGLASNAIPPPEAGEHHWPTVANHALARVTASFFPDAQAEIDGLANEFDERATITESATTLARSAARGALVAEALLRWCDGDGFSDLATCDAGFTPPLAPDAGGWEATGDGQGNGAFPCWGTLRCFALAETAACAAADHPEYSTVPGSSFHTEALFVRDTTGNHGANLTYDQDWIAHYWADGAGATGTPAGHWIGITGVVIKQENLKLDRAAEAYARVGIAVGDAFVTCWRTKYDSYLKRPLTYIRETIDSSWTPLLATPGFPSYSSGHSTQSAAAASVLTAMFGRVAFTDTSHTDLDPELDLGSRTYASFLDAAHEAAVSRLYGGIHYAFDNDEGFAQGLCIGESIGERIVFAE